MQINSIEKNSLCPIQEVTSVAVKESDCIKSSSLKKGVFIHVSELFNKLIFRILLMFSRKKVIKNEPTPVICSTQSEKTCVKTSIGEFNMFRNLASYDECKTQWQKVMLDFLMQQQDIKSISLEKAIQTFENNCRNQLAYPVLSWDGTLVRAQVLNDAWEFLLYKGFVSEIKL